MKGIDKMENIKNEKYVYVLVVEYLNREYEYKSLERVEGVYTSEKRGLMALSRLAKIGNLSPKLKKIELNSD
jgi:hypothetical protein